MPERRFRVRGQVQGVGFRWWTRSQAQRLGLSGMVRNRPDGSVEVEAAGPDAALSELRQLLRQGPPSARVDAVDEEPATGVTGGEFQIAR